MTEKDKMQHPPQKAEINNKIMAKTAIEQYRSNYARIIWTLISGGLIFASVYIFIYTQTKIWQLWGAIGSIIVAIACAPISYYNLTRQKQNAAGYWALIGLSIAYGGAEIFFSGATLYIAVGGTLLIILLNSILLPKKWQSWTIAVALFGAYIWLVNAFEPLTRYDITQTPLLRYVIPGLTGILVILSLWQVIRSFRVGTIRTRLLISFTAVAILLTVIISATWIVISYRNAQEQLIRQLESVATLKEAEIQTWTNNLQVNLNLVLSGEKAIPNLRTILAPEAEGTAEYASASKELQERLQWAIAQMNLFDEMLILDTQGQLMVSTKPAEASETYTNETYFQQGLEETYIRPPTYAPSVNKTTVLVLQPVRDEKEKVIAILAGHAKVDALSEIMTERAGLGTTGETYLVDTGYGMLTESRFGEKEGYMSTQGVNTAIDEQTNGSGSYKNYRGTTVIGSYHWLPEFQVALLAEQNQAEAFSARNKVITINIAMALAAILLSIGISLLITRSIANPLGSLAETATQIASGNLERTAEVTREDEIGSLAQAFNQMTAQLLDLIGGLEERVLERTRDLEQRSTYLEASAEVSRAAASILDANQLVQEVVELISERFGLYYVGLFLVDEASEWATLQAGTGEAGRQMLDKGHRLGVGGASMIGQCVSQAEAHIALDVGEEAVRFDNPLLPETRSEGALPLRSRGRVLGAFTIQSSEVSAFDAETITVLQTMADQVAVALDNAQLFTEANNALEAERRAYGELSRQAWSDLLRTRDWGYDFENMSLVTAQGNWSNAMRQVEKTGQSIRSDSEASLTIPIEIRGQVLGVLNFDKDNPEERWTPEEQRLLEGLAEELGRVLESARLYQDTQRSAAQERLTSEVTARMRETLDVETVLKTAVSEISEALGLAALDVQFGPAPNELNENTLE